MREEFLASYRAEPHLFLHVKNDMDSNINLKISTYYKICNIAILKHPVARRRSEVFAWGEAVAILGRAVPFWPADPSFPSSCIIEFFRGTGT